MNDIFELDVDIIVCPINCDGVMTGGLSLKFAQHYPEFERRLQAQTLKPGRVQIYVGDTPPIIVGFPTCERWHEGAHIEFIIDGLKDLKIAIDVGRRALNLNCNSIAFPALGCGIGGLDWADVRPLLEAFEMPDLEVTILEPLEK